MRRYFNQGTQKPKAGAGLGALGGSKKKNTGGIFPGDFENFTKSKEFKERKDKSHKGEVKAFKKYRERTATTRDEAKTQNMAKGGRVGYLKGGQAKLDANKDGKISGEDFAILRGKKKNKKKKMVAKKTKSPMQQLVRKS